MAKAIGLATTRVYLLANPEKDEARDALDALTALLQAKCSVIGSAAGLDGRAAVDAGADRIVVIGGDGTLIGVARSLGKHQTPLIAVNVGKLGYLTEFSVDELTRCADQALHDDLLISRRMVLQSTTSRGDTICRETLAINDCVVQAGPPFRMVTLGVRIDGARLTQIAGDGLVVCTPSGSTGHNLSAGGPILEPGVDAIVLAPLNPHSLTHKPLVIERDAVIEIEAISVNEGTTVIVDGQVSCPFRAGDRVTLERFPADMLVVRNPLLPRRHSLISKLHWGHGPNYR